MATGAWDEVLSRRIGESSGRNIKQSGGGRRLFESVVDN
jgi:hypothetical protein